MTSFDLLKFEPKLGMMPYSRPTVSVILSPRVSMRFLESIGAYPTSLPSNELSTQSAKRSENIAVSVWL